MTGRGFAPDELVDLLFDSMPATRTRADASGDFSTKLFVPATSRPGPHQVSATGESSVVTASAAFTVRTNWRKFHFDLANSGANPFENVLDPSNVFRLSRAWAIQTAGQVWSSPAVVDGVLYVGTKGANGTADAFLYAVDAATGQIKWVQKTQGLDPTSPAVARGVVYMGTLYDHALHAFDSATGDPVWTFQANGAMSSPAVVNGVIYGGSNASTLYALRASDGAVIWKAFASRPFSSTPAVAEGTVYAGSWDHNLYAFDTKTGATRWTAPTGDLISSSAAVDKGVVYVGVG